MSTRSSPRWGRARSTAARSKRSNGVALRRSRCPVVGRSASISLGTPLRRRAVPSPRRQSVGARRSLERARRRAVARPRVAQPTLLIVSGPSGSGKTQLSHALASAIGCPAILRDEIKEGMVHAQGSGFSPSVGDELTRRTYPLFFEIVRRLLEGGVTVVAEAAFKDVVWRQGLEPLSSLATLRIIRCVVSDDVARERRLRRMAVPTRAAHADVERLDIRASRFDAISLPTPTLVVDTTDGYSPDVPEILRFVSGGGTAPAPPPTLSAEAARTPFRG